MAKKLISFDDQKAGLGLPDAVESRITSSTTPRVTTPEQETATLGPDLMTASGWTLGDGWTGDLDSGFTKTPGSTSPLTWTPPTSSGTDVWLVEWSWEGTSTDQDVYAGYDVYLGGGYAGITYQGAAPANSAYSRAIKSVEDGPLEFRPWAGFEGRIHSISVRKALSAAAVGIGWRNSVGNRGGELRFGDSQAVSVYLGIDSGKWNYSGHRNVAVGDYSMNNNVTGFFNAAVGFEALSNNVNGTRNVAFGYRALRENVAGDRNIGIGPFALTRNTTGQRNVAIGVDVLWRSTVGNDNVGIGYLTQTELRSGESNIAIGRYAMQHTHGATDGSTSHNIAIGRESLGHIRGSGNIAIGHRASAKAVTAVHTVAIGSYALEVSNTTRQTAIGYQALRHFTGERNTALGSSAMLGVSGESTGIRNVAVGDNAAGVLTSGSQNTVIGPSAGPNITTESRNILIGFSTYVQTGRDDFLNIGNVLYGDLAEQRFGIGLHTPTARLHLRASNGTAGSAPLKVQSGTLLSTPEVGALEFADGKLYFTTSSGTRQEIAFVTTDPTP